MPLRLLVLKLTDFKITWICEQELDLSAQPEHCSLSKQFHTSSSGLRISCPRLLAHAIMLAPGSLEPAEYAMSVS